MAYTVFQADPEKQMRTLAAALNIVPNAYFGPEEQMQQVKAAQLSNALNEALQPYRVQEAQNRATAFPMEQSIRQLTLQGLQRQAANAPMEEAILNAQRGVFSSPQVAGRPETVPAMPLGQVSPLEQAISTAELSPSDQSRVLEEYVPPVSPKQIAPGTVYAPELSKDVEMASRKHQQEMEKVTKQAELSDATRQSIANALAENRIKVAEIGAQSRQDVAETNAQAKLDAATAKTAQSFDVDPLALKGALNLFKTTGQVPSFGFGKSSLREAFFAALGGAGEEGGADMVSEAVASRAIRSGLQRAYTTQQNLLAANTVAIKTIDGQMELAKPLMAKQDPTGMPFLNKYVLWSRGQIEGDADTAAAQQIIKTMSNEFAKIMSGAAASIAGVTVNSAADAEKLLNVSMTNGQFLKVADMMRKEGAIRMDEQRKEAERLRAEIQQIGKEPSAGASAAPLVPGEVPVFPPKGESSGIPKEVGQATTITVDGIPVTVRRTK